MSRLFAIFITHTHERIARSVMSMAAQTAKPDAVIVSCDGDSPTIQPEIVRAAAAINRPVTLVTRPHTGEARPAQTRNNAVRALQSRFALRDEDRLVFLDGDCMAPPGALAAHETALRGGHISLGWRIELTQAQTDRLTDQHALTGTIDALTDESQHAEVDRAARTHRRRNIQRVLNITKPHKPQVLGANFGVRAWVYRAVNGMDETYTGWGMEDDDLGRRIYALGGRPTLRLRECMVLHQFHPTRARGAWMDNDQARRIGTPFRTACDHGLSNPLPQSQPIIVELGPGHIDPVMEIKPARMVRAG